MLDQGEMSLESSATLVLYFVMAHSTMHVAKSWQFCHYFVCWFTPLWFLSLISHWFMSLANTCRTVQDPEAPRETRPSEETRASGETRASRRTRPRDFQLIGVPKTAVCVLSLLVKLSIYLELDLWTVCFQFHYYDFCCLPARHAPNCSQL